MAERNKLVLRIIQLMHKLPSRQLMIVLSIIIGFLVGLIAVFMKNAVRILEHLLTNGFAVNYHNYLYFIYPGIGILAAVLFIRYLLRRPVRDGIPNVLYALSRQNGIINGHNTYSSVVTSILTVGFGGSVGLEGPTVVTGAAWGSNLGKVLGLNYKQIVALVGISASASLSAIFKAPIAAIVFALEIILFDMTMTALVPLLVSSIVATLTSYFFLGQNVLYPFKVVHSFELSETPYYLLLGIFTALISVYFIRTYVYTGKIFEKLQGWVTKLIVGAILLGVFIFFLPSLYGEGYESVNEGLKGNMEFVFDNSIFYAFKDNMHVTLLLLLSVVLFKVLATSLTFRSGGIGGVFAPTLFIGTMTGLLFVKFLNNYGLTHLPESNFALVGMAGLLAGVVHAPLTAIFLSVEITGGYELIFPIMLVATTSYALSKLLSPRSIYTIQLASRGDVLTHHKDRSLLAMMAVSDYIEKDFLPVDINANLGELVKIIAQSNRNIYPVVGNDNTFFGIISLDQIRHNMFKPELYETTKVRNLMFMPTKIVQMSDDMETVATKFQHSGKYNLVVLDGDKYVGFVSRSNVFSSYRELLQHISDE
ncbi:MAG TPA: chloride channel protein [Saprospiraceae bacterium]|nr:chloride channel protein [Saprospiraceae bacterium]